MPGTLSVKDISAICGDSGSTVSKDRTALFGYIRIVINEDMSGLNKDSKYVITRIVKLRVLLGDGKIYVSNNKNVLMDVSRYIIHLRQ